VETYVGPQSPCLNFLKVKGEEINFYQAVRMLEGLSDSDGNSKKIKFKVKNSQAFHPNFIDDIKQQDEQLQVTVNGFGVTGPQGPLPDVYSEMLYRNNAKGDHAPEAFLNLFHDRLLHSLYQIKKDFDPMLFSTDMAQSKLYKLMSAICGMTTTDLFQRLPLSANQLVAFSSILANRRVDYSCICNLVSMAFDCKVEVQPCEGAWDVLPKEYRYKLGKSSAILGNHGMGIGKKYWNNQAAIGIDLHLKDKQQCCDLLPKGKYHNALGSLLTFVTDGRYLMKIRLFLDWQAVPESKLTKDNPMTLSQTAWLKSNDATDNQTLNYPNFILHPSLSRTFGEQAL
jgi:type VI secretion system protein ImpH